MGTQKKNTSGEKKRKKKKKKKKKRKLKKKRKRKVRRRPSEQQPVVVVVVFYNRPRRPQPKQTTITKLKPYNICRSDERMQGPLSSQSTATSNCIQHRQKRSEVKSTRGNFGKSALAVGREDQIGITEVVIGGSGCNDRLYTRIWFNVRSRPGLSDVKRLYVFLSLF